MIDNNSAIGIFDSGIGGLTVVKEIIKYIPNENIIYFGDTARVPYGSKSRDTIIKYSKQIIHFLLKQNVKAIVIACNTASAYALDVLQKDCPVPIIGVIKPGANEAISTTCNKKIGVIATRATVSSNIYVSYINSIDSTISVQQKACPLLCPLVEEEMLYDDITNVIIKLYVDELKNNNIDTLILGCTHYPLLIDSIQNIMGPNINLINPAHETAINLRQLLIDNNIINNSNNKIYHKFYVSDMADKFQNFASFIIPNTAINTQLINLEES